MKRYKLYTVLLAVLTLGMAGCELNKVDVYLGPDLVHFIDKSGGIIVDDTNPTTTIEIGTTTVSDIDRSYTVTLNSDESTAVEGVDFEFVTNNVTIPAGEAVGSFEIRGLFSGVSVEGTVANFSLVASAGDVAEFNNTYLLELYKFCNYNQDAFIGSYTIYENSVIYGSYNYEASTIAGGNSFSIVVNGFWDGSLGVPVSVSFNSREASCSIPEQEVFFHPDYGQAYIRSLEDGTFNSCTGRIDGLKYMVYVAAGYFDISISNWVMNEPSTATTKSTFSTKNKMDVESLTITPFTY